MLNQGAFGGSMLAGFALAATTIANPLPHTKAFAAAVFYGPASVLVTSFSRAAAAELTDRDLPINPDKIGTLHSHCYHALGAPVVAESCVDEWNRENPRLALTASKKRGKIDGEDAAEDGFEQSRTATRSCSN